MDKEKNNYQSLQSSSKVVGSKQVLKGISDGTVRCVIVAADADFRLKRKIADCAAEYNVRLITVPSKKRLGEQAGIEVATATVGLCESVHKV